MVTIVAIAHDISTVGILRAEAFKVDVTKFVHKPRVQGSQNSMLVKHRKTVNSAHFHAIKYSMKHVQIKLSIMTSTTLKSGVIDQTSRHESDDLIEAIISEFFHLIFQISAAFKWNEDKDKLNATIFMETHRICAWFYRVDVYLKYSIPAN